MKVILLRDVAKIGRRFEIVDVPDGFALNKLIPKKDAEPATPTNIKRVNQNKERLQANKSELLAQVKSIVEKLNAEPLSLAVEANEIGHLFQAINTKNIANYAKDRGLNLSDDWIIIETPIKSIGEHKVKIKVQDFISEITLRITAK